MSQCVRSMGPGQAAGGVDVFQHSSGEYQLDSSAGSQLPRSPRRRNNTWSGTLYRMGLMLLLIFLSITVTAKPSLLCIATLCQKNISFHSMK